MCKGFHEKNENYFESGFMLKSIDMETVFIYNRVYQIKKGRTLVRMVNYLE